MRLLCDQSLHFQYYSTSLPNCSLAASSEIHVQLVLQGFCYILTDFLFL